MRGAEKWFIGLLICALSACASKPPMRGGGGGSKKKPPPAARQPNAQQDNVLRDPNELEPFQNLLQDPLLFEDPLTRQAILSGLRPEDLRRPGQLPFNPVFRDSNGQLAARGGDNDFSLSQNSDLEPAPIVPSAPLHAGQSPPASVSSAAVHGTTQPGVPIQRPSVPAQ